MKKNKKVVKRTKVETEVQNQDQAQSQPKRRAGNFHIEFKNQAQKDAWKTIEKNEITFYRRH